MALTYLIFDATEAEDGSGSFDAMASAAAAGWPALQAELAAVLTWVHAAFPAGPGPLDDGCDWDLDLTATEDSSRPLQLQFDAACGRLSASPDLPARPTVRHTVSLTLSGSAVFCAAFSARFDIGADPDTTR